MGGTQAARVLTDIKFNSTADRKKEASAEEIESYYQNIYSTYETEGSPYYATARLWDDGIIDPVSTRATLALAFASTGFSTTSAGNYGVFRM